MSLFDPLGLVAPVLIHGRMMMQDLWRDNLGWDEEVNEAPPRYPFSESRDATLALMIQAQIAHYNYTFSSMLAS